jgi:ribosome-associated translation inhibitor RaiA
VIKVHAYDLHEAINALIDKLDHKIRKERDKITDHKG